MIGVYFPKGAETGGPEALHQLVDSLRRHGIPAVLIPMPGTEGNTPVEQYRSYNAPICAYAQNLTHVVVPEICPELLERHPYANRYVWWLAAGDPTGLEKYNHLTQSHYAKEVLLGHGVESKMLSDYTPHLPQIKDKPNGGRQIAYNGNKGADRVELLRQRMPDVTWVEIKNMSRSTVHNVLDRSAIYLDLGHHPGKDRLPREAAVRGCIVMTGKEGSAGNQKDVPIKPSLYKVDGETKSIVEQLYFSLASPNAFYLAQRTYREKIVAEPVIFDEEVLEVFG